jgi:hypothetical protein
MSPLNSDVFSFNVAKFPQSLAESLYAGSFTGSGGSAEAPDDGDFSPLLRFG